jgi:secreted trypsin-like serine protease
MKVLVALSVLLVVAAAVPWPTRPHKTTTTTQRTTHKPTTTTAHHKTTTTPHQGPTTTAAPGSCGNPAIKPDTSQRIVGGVDAIPYSWPWQVALFTGKGAFAYQFCGGTVISPNWIMTAGHCFYGQTDPSNYKVKAGVFDKTKNETGEVVVGISEIHVNPQYDPSTITWDITLLKLAQPLTFDDHISPVCLPAQGEDLPDAGSATYVTGWGTTSQGGQDSKTLKQVSVPIVSTDDCKAAYPGAIYPDTQFCAGLKQGGKDTCQGDSGGPVVYQDSTTGTWKQLGITSWGNGCAQPNYYGVYSKVSAYIDFIHQYVTDL